MAEIRLSKLIKQFSVGLDALVDFLNTQGYNPPRNPNAKVPDTALPTLHNIPVGVHCFVFVLFYILCAISFIPKVLSEKR